MKENSNKRNWEFGIQISELLQKHIWHFEGPETSHCSLIFFSPPQNLKTHLDIQASQLQNYLQILQLF